MGWGCLVWQEEAEVHAQYHSSSLVSEMVPVEWVQMAQTAVVVGVVGGAVQQQPWQPLMPLPPAFWLVCVPQLPVPLAPTVL
mmetsp:Transcript_108960/g.313890  ORF Transcript_108960/g.313890 Transcript_108960/m.313890 type:complete len:82 (+) Transcript_108960:119-364(+)